LRAPPLMLVQTIGLWVAVFHPRPLMPMYVLVLSAGAAAAAFVDVWHIFILVCLSPCNDELGHPYRMHTQEARFPRPASTRQPLPFLLRDSLQGPRPRFGIGAVDGEGKADGKPRFTGEEEQRRMTEDGTGETSKVPDLARLVSSSLAYRPYLHLPMPMPMPPVYLFTAGRATMCSWETGKQGYAYGERV
ncbi:hypothetical protein CI238_09021, partial [Colletotrichum incanum]